MSSPHPLYTRTALDAPVVALPLKVIHLPSGTGRLLRTHVTSWPPPPTLLGRSGGWTLQIRPRGAPGGAWRNVPGAGPSKRVSAKRAWDTTWVVPLGHEARAVLQAWEMTPEEAACWSTAELAAFLASPVAQVRTAALRALAYVGLPNQRPAPQYRGPVRASEDLHQCWIALRP